MPGKGLRMLGVVLLACSVLTGLGFLLKAPCMGHYDANRNRDLCVNDIQVLYVNRDMDEGMFPYIHGSLHGLTLLDGAIEYPVLTGLFAWVPTQFVSNDSQYLVATSLLLAPFSLLTAWLLFGMVRWRALLYALAPPLIWYSFHNWDLLVVTATVMACYAWWKGRTATAAILLVVGGCLKLWPIFFLAPLVLHRLRSGDRRDAVRVTLSAVAAFVLINGYFVLVNFKGWWASYQFQALRDADITSNSIWYWAFRSIGNQTLNRIVPALLALSFTAALVYGWRRSKQADEPYPFIQVSAAILCAFLLFNKAHSPQYALWLLPFFALLQVRWTWWATYLIFDTALYFGLFRWYYDRGVGIDFGPAKVAMLIGVWGRAVMLVLLFVLFLRSRPAVQIESADQAEPEPALLEVLPTGIEVGSSSTTR